MGWADRVSEGGPTGLVSEPSGSPASLQAAAAAAEVGVCAKSEDNRGPVGTLRADGSETLDQA